MKTVPTTKEKLELAIKGQSTSLLKETYVMVAAKEINAQTTLITDIIFNELCNRESIESLTLWLDSIYPEYAA